MYLARIDRCYYHMISWMLSNSDGALVRETCTSMNVILDFLINKSGFSNSFTNRGVSFLNQNNNISIAFIQCSNFF